MKIIKFYGGGFLRDFYEDKEIAQVIKALDGSATLLYTKQNAVGLYAMVFEVENVLVKQFKETVKNAMPTRKLEFDEL